MNISRLFSIGVLLLLIPLFFLNVKDSHDWGDDFAQYLIQARNIVEGRQQTDNGLIMNSENNVYAIKAYPVGLPLILAPIYYFFGLSIFPYDLLITAFLVFAGFFCYKFLSAKINHSSALLITLLFCYNPLLLEIKKSILSEIPFTAVLLILLVWTEHPFYRKKYSWLITGLILCALVSLRLAGLTVIIAYTLFEWNAIRLNLKNNERNSHYKKLGYSLFLAISLFYSVNELFFRIDVPGLLKFYLTSFSSLSFKGAENISDYYTQLKFVFPFFGTSIPSFWIFAAFAGWLISFIKSPSLSEFIFPVYSLLIIFYPYSDAGLRFIIPILPLLIFYAIIFLYNLISKSKYHFLILNILIVFLLCGYIRPVSRIISSQYTVEDGPQKNTSQELFSYIKRTPQNTSIVFCRARAMSLYSGRPSQYPGKNQTDEEIHAILFKQNPLYIVLPKVNGQNEIIDARMEKYIEKNIILYTMEWENDAFKIYKQKNN